MKRTILSLAFVVAIFIGTQVNAMTIGQGIFAYECSHATLVKDGFTCKMDHGAHFQIGVDARQLSKVKADYYSYMFNKIVFRIYELGGHRYTVTSIAWPPGAEKFCTVRYQGKFAVVCQNK